MHHIVTGQKGLNCCESFTEYALDVICEYFERATQGRLDESFDDSIEQCMVDARKRYTEDVDLDAVLRDRIMFSVYSVIGAILFKTYHDCLVQTGNEVPEKYISIREAINVIKSKTREAIAKEAAESKETTGNSGNRFRKLCGDSSDVSRPRNTKIRNDTASHTVCPRNGVCTCKKVVKKKKGKKEA